jgi:SNF2 family DNA or RNA helicase
VWIPLSDLQKTIYAQIVNSATVKHTIHGHDKKHIFVIIQALKQLCVHPMILLNKIYKEVKDGEGD